MRFDLFAARRLNISRNKAAELIKSGKILLNGQICVKPSLEVGEFDGFESSDEVNLDGGERGLSGNVSGGGVNLTAFRDGGKFDVTGQNLDAAESIEPKFNGGEFETASQAQDLRGANLSDAAKTAYKKTDEKNLNESGVNLASFLKTKPEKCAREDKNLKANSAKIELVGEIYVGRGALKLKSFLATCALDARGKNALDVGSSTGGFVQVLLQNGVASVTALDVGSSQLDASLRADPRVIVAENTDVREFAANFNSPSDAGKFDDSKFGSCESSQNGDKSEHSKSNLTEQGELLNESDKTVSPSNLTEADKNEQTSKRGGYQRKNSNLGKVNSQTDYAVASNSTKINARFDARLDEVDLIHANSQTSIGAIEINIQVAVRKSAVNLTKASAQAEFAVNEINLTKVNNLASITASEQPNLPQNARPSAPQIAREGAKSGPSDAEKEKKKFDLITCDVSFISLREILPSIYVLAGANCDIIVLFKPQFEVGRHVKRNKKGVVTDVKAVREARAKFELAAANLGWIMRQTRECEVKGKEGNAEFFYAFNKR